MPPIADRFDPFHSGPLDRETPEIMKFPCTLCGSRNWPSSETSCPLCYEPEEEAAERTAEEEEQGNHEYHAAEDERLMAEG